MSFWSAPTNRTNILAIIFLIAGVVVYFQFQGISISLPSQYVPIVSGNFGVMHDGGFYAQFLTNDIPIGDIYTPSKYPPSVQDMRWMYSPVVYSFLHFFLGDFSEKNLFITYSFVYVATLIIFLSTLSLFFFGKLTVSSNFDRALYFSCVFFLCAHSTLIVSTAGNVSTILTACTVSAICGNSHGISLFFRCLIVIIKPTWAPILLINSIVNGRLQRPEIGAMLVIMCIYAIDFTIRPNMYFLWISMLTGVTLVGNDGSFLLALLRSSSILKVGLGLLSLSLVALTIQALWRQHKINSSADKRFAHIACFIAILIVIPRNYIYDLYVCIVFVVNFCLSSVFCSKNSKNIAIADIMVLVTVTIYCAVEIKSGRNFFTPTAYQLLLFWSLFRIYHMIITSNKKVLPSLTSN